MPASVSDSVWAWTQLSLWPKIFPHGSSERDRPHRPQAHSPKNTEQLSRSSSRSFTRTKQTQELTQGNKRRGLGDGCARIVMQCRNISHSSCGKTMAVYYETISDLVHAQEKAQLLFCQNEHNFRLLPDKCLQISAWRKKLLAVIEYPVSVVAWEKFIKSHKAVSPK